MSSGLGELAPMGFVAQLCLAAPSVDGALRLACRFSPIWSEVSLEADYADSLVTVRSLTPCSTEDGGALEAVRAFGTLTRMLACVGERDVSVRAARAPLRLRAAVSEVVGCEVQEHESELALCFDAHDVQRPNARADLPLYEVLTRHAEQRLVDMISQKSVDARVRETIDQLSGSARAYLVAARLGIGVRTLHRRLRAEGTSFRRIHDEMRMERCLRELTSGAVTAKHVAQKLGFADPASFHRAFKRWTGSTVRGYRGQSARRRGEHSKVAAESADGRRPRPGASLLSP